jgi:hypothetical protein
MMLRPPWQAIKIPLLLLLAALSLAGAGAWWSSGLLLDARKHMQQQALATQTARQKLQRSNIEKSLIQQHLGGYQALAARGFIGEENRLAWLEAVQQANRDAHLYGLDYSLEPRAASPAPLAGGLPLGQSAMKLRMPMLLEDDLPRFLDALRQRASGVFRVRSCEMSRGTDVAPEASSRPGLQVECELLWFTVAEMTKDVR